MGFDYEKLKSRVENGDNFWVSYSDLFMMLSVVFLMLYAVTSLRSGTFGIEKNLEAQRVAYENEDLKQQIKVYETLKDQYMKESTPQDMQVYEELMGQLHLLKDEAQDENSQLQKKIAENKSKENALNKYQQIVRNMINSNVLAQARVKRRDKIIKEKEVEISSKKTEISSLRKDVEQKQKAIAKGEAQIEKANQSLAAKIQEIKKAHAAKKMSEEKMEQSIAQLRRSTAEKITNLQESKRQLESDVNSISSQLDLASRDLESAHSTIQAKDQEKQKLVDELQFVRSNYQGQMTKLQNEFNQKRQREQEMLRGLLPKRRHRQAKLPNEKRS